MRRSVRPRKKIRAPEKRTLVEILASWGFIPYPLASLVLALVIAFPGRILACILDSMSLRQAIETVLPSSTAVPLWRVLVGDALLPAVAFYMFLVVRYMRTQVVTTKDKLASLLPKGRRDYSRAFRLAGLWYGPIPLAAFLLLAFNARFRADLRSATGFFDSVFAAVSMSANMLLYATVIWVYFTSLYGMLRIGTMRLKMLSYYQDELLGLRPMGTLSLAMARAYFGALILLILFHIFNLTFAPLVVTTTLFAMLVLGVLMFFLPLVTIHRQMVEVKHRERASLRSQLAHHARPLEVSGNRGEDPGAALDDIRTILGDVKEILASSVLENRMAAMPTWPLDLAILERLLTVFFGVIAGILVRIITTTVFP